MFLRRIAIPVLGLFVGFAGAGIVRAAGVPQGQHSQYAQDRDAWDAPPHQWKEIQRRGFQDGIDGARKDYGNNRRPDVNNRDEYRRPSLPYDLREPYREGFRRGYERAMSHLMGDRDRNPHDRDERVREPEHHGRDIAEETRQRGFEDGMEGARKDIGNHRRPNVNNRDEYRRPSVPYELQRDYREGFRRGYEKAMAEMTGGHGPR